MPEDKTKKVKKAADKYFAKLNQQLKKDVGFEYTPEEQQAFTDLVMQLQYQGSDSVDRLVTLLNEVGYNKREITAVLEELQALSAMRLLIKIYTNIPREERAKIEDFEDRLSPAQMYALIETVYKNKTGEDLDELATNLHNDTCDAMYKDVNVIWEDVKKAAATGEKAVE